MIDYLDFLERVDSGLATEDFRVWRQLSLHNGRPIGLYVAGQKGKFGGLSEHLFITYIKTASPDDFERYANDCLEYALKACEVPPHKQLLSSIIILPCIATHTTFRELVEESERTEKFGLGEGKEFAGGIKSGFLQTAILPCLLNLTTHKSFHSGAQQGFTEAIFKAGEDLLDQKVVSANAPPDLDKSMR